MARRFIASLWLLCAAGGAPVAGADARWTMVRAETLTVIGDEPPATLRNVAIQLEQFRVVVAGLIHNADRPPSLPTTVYVFGTRKAMQPYVPLARGKPVSLAGFFQRDADTNTIVLSLEGFDESAAVAYHEYTHLLVGNAVRSVPVWLSEGLAEYYSTYRLAENGKEADIGRPPEGRLSLLRDRSLPLADLIAVDKSSALYNEGNKRSIFYAQAWAFIHYLLTQVPNGGAAINRYVAEIAEGQAPHEAFYNAFGSSPADLDARLRVYAQRSLYSGTKFTFKDKVSTPPPAPARALTAAEANAWLGDLQRRVSREAEAAPRIDAAVAAEPDAAITHLAAGLLRMTQQRTSEGLAELERAAALAPLDFLTQYLHGVWLLREDLSASAEQSGSAAAALSRATRLRPQSSEAHAWLAYAQMQNAATLRDARASIERAIELAPGRADYRLRWADVRMLQGGYADARAALTAIAAIRTDPRAAEGAAQRLETLVEYERRAAEHRSHANLRALRPGEQRAFGLLTRIDCSAGEIRFHVIAAPSGGRRAETGRTIVGTTTSMEDVELISYIDEKALTLGCGVRTQPDAVSFTWTPRDAASGASGGVAVAIEFLPKGFIP